MEFWALDTEDNSKGKVYMINLYDGKEHHTFKKPEEAREFISKLNKVQIWCVNLQYDLINTYRGHLNLLEISMVGGRVISAKVLGTSVVFRDTLNHWKISVKEMGKRIGLEKLDHGKSFNNRKYCRRDTEITYRFLMTMKTHYDNIGCKLNQTIGSTSLAYFYDNYSSRPKNPMTQTQLEFCLKGYYGGRTEIFFNKPISGNIHYFDVNGLYPFSMRNLFPIPETGKFRRKINLQENEGMIDVTIQAPKIDVPYLPHRDEKTKRLLFPVGLFRGVYTYFEIREAKKLGYKIRTVHRALEFDGLCRPFEDFVNQLYSKRLEAKQNKDELLSDVYKNLMNNLYGKFAQGNVFQKLIPYAPGKAKNGDQIYGNLIVRDEVGDYPRHTNGIWAAYTTAYGRHYLYDAYRKIRENGGLLIYSDTDSVIFEAPKPIFKESKDLGGLKSEGVFSHAHFKLPKVYALIEKTTKKKVHRAKGVPRANAPEFFETGKATFKRPLKIKEVLRRNLSPKRKIKLIMNDWVATTKEMRAKYDKRIVLKSGHTKPITLGVKQ